MTSGPTPLLSEVTIVPADDPARASWFLGARLSAHPINSVEDLRAVVDQRVVATRARVAHAEAELARQLADELADHDETIDSELIENADAIRLAVGLPEDAELHVARMRQQAHDLRSASARLAEAEAAIAEGEHRLHELAPGATITSDVELLHEASQDIALAESAAQAAQRDLGTAAKAVRPEQRIELRVAGKRAFQTDQHLKQALRETKPLLLAAIALLVVAAVAWGAAAAGAVTTTASALLSGVLVLLAAGSLLQRRSIVGPARRACAGAEAEATRVGRQLRDQEDQFGDWGVRVMQAMASDDALRAALERWGAIAGHDSDPQDVEHLAAAVSALDDARAVRLRAGEEQNRLQAEWSATAEALGIDREPSSDPLVALDLAERALARRHLAGDQLRRLHDAERRVSARLRLDELLRGRALDEIEREAQSLVAEAGDDAGGERPLLYVDPGAMAPDERVELLEEARRLGPEGRFVVVTRDPTEWNVAGVVVRRAHDVAEADEPAIEIDLRDTPTTSDSPVAENRPWFAS